MATARLLLVDDEARILAGMKVYFENAGYQVDCATERTEAEALIRGVPYSCVITDLRLSGSTGNEGLDLLDTLRTERPSTRSILLTAYSSPAVEVEALARGASVCLAKPQRLSELEWLVKSLIEAQ